MTLDGRLENSHKDKHTHTHLSNQAALRCPNFPLFSEWMFISTVSTRRLNFSLTVLIVVFTLPQF